MTRELRLHFGSVVVCYSGDWSRTIEQSINDRLVYHIGNHDGGGDSDEQFNIHV
ncbi:hypothetical protein [Vibrio parahaemolyticus]|uniref:hypothetical protein n=1 Tax=Vibrio parahaemolyticus TaxID=670 RepID=UPI00155369D9|nr:hypothetical protein [Vibrio parahaemolyticus]MDF4269718.1 hypothetical protein [Vibrio parahaemolyticus]MDF4275054.1 hypothetical protein [Vibrio parahaemolyticus]MDF4299646.1 hypothetical protein [Vibrio parahaemolyticus]